MATKTLATVTRFARLVAVTVHKTPKQQELRRQNWLGGVLILGSTIVLVVWFVAALILESIPL